MWAYRVFSNAMSQIGKPISRLEDIARYLQPEAPVSSAPSPPPAYKTPDTPRPVYAGAPVAEEDDCLVFDTTPRLTSQLDFAPDRLGYLVNDEGLVLMGHADDAEAPGGSLRLAPIRLEEGPVMPARATTTVRYKANLPETPLTGADETDVDPDTLAQQALAGGEIGAFDMRGRAITIRLRWARVGANCWRLLYRVMGHALTTRAAARGWQALDQDFAFDARGRLTDLAPVNLDLGRGADPVSLELGRSGLTQFPDSTGLVKVLACSQNGWPRAALREVALREDGRVLGCFDNGRIGLLGVAAFANARAKEPARRAA